MLTRLAHLLKQGIDRGEFRFGVPFEEWPHLTNERGYDMAETIAYPGTDAVAELARFLLKSQRAFTNEEHIRLNVELSVLMGPKWDQDAYVSDQSRGYNIIYQEGYHVPAVLSGFTGWPQDHFFDPLEE